MPFFKTISKNKALSAALFLGGLHVACDLLGSLTFFPIIHYGMYSEKVARQESYQRFELVVNGTKLDALDFRINSWEALTNPIAIHQRIKQSNDFQTEKGFLEKGFQFFLIPDFYSWLNHRISNKQMEDTDFGRRYKNYLSSVLNVPVNSLQVYDCEYGYENARYFLKHKTLLFNE